jgi:hypothetical protein
MHPDRLAIPPAAAAAARAKGVPDQCQPIGMRLRGAPAARVNLRGRVESVEFTFLSYSARGSRAPGCGAERAAGQAAVVRETPRDLARAGRWASLAARGPDQPRASRSAAVPPPHSAQAQGHNLPLRPPAPAAPARSLWCPRVPSLRNPCIANRRSASASQDRQPGRLERARHDARLRHRLWLVHEVSGGARACRS